MKAAVYHGRGDVRREEREDPRPGPGEVKLQVAYCGICGSDIHEFYEGPIVIPTEPHPRSGAQAPLIVGHEYSGVVAELGEGVEDLAVGDRVTVEPINRVDDGSDPHYNRGALVVHHGTMADGGFADYSVLKRSSLHRLPDEVDLVQGALIEPMAVGYHAFRRADLREGDNGAVFGAGPIGLGAMFAMRDLGLERIFVVEPSARRRAVAERHGAIGVDPRAEDAVEKIMDLTAGVGIHGSVEAAGTGPSFATATAVAATGATISLVAVFVEPVTFNPTEHILRETTLKLSNAYCNDFPTVIEMMARGAYPTEDWVELVGWDSFIEQFPRLRDGEAVKLVVEVNGG